MFSGLFGGKAGYTGDAERQERLARERLQAATGYAQEQVQPYADVGRQGLTAMQQAMGFGGDATAENYGFLNQRFGADQLETDPSYQFRLDEGNKGIERAMAATGKTFSPEAVKALSNYGQQSASQEYGNAYNRFTGDQTNMYNRLAGMTDMGQAQAANLGNLELAEAGGVSDLASNLVNFQAAAREGRANRSQGMFNTLVSAAATASAPAAASDKRLKENIEKVGEKNGFNIYEFNYIETPDTRWRGVMAQEVQDIMPDAVVEMPNGYLAVDYGKIGVEFVEVE
tara:strand:- start:435 stop:1289 length:855 start_codon:yes stop_codon:yes gene_type:complete